MGMPLLMVCVAAMTAGGTDALRDVVYKSVDGTELHLFIFDTGGREGKPPAPAIVFFHGGGWRSGAPSALYKQCEHFAGRGMVAVSVQYRLVGGKAKSVADCVRDGISAMRWVRGHAKELGIDPDRVVASGGSAGGHIAAETALASGFDEPNEDLSISPKPNALVLFNPAVLIPEKSRFAAVFDGQEKGLSPADHIVKGIPPTIILHGSADEVVPLAAVELFRDRMKAAENICELVVYDGKGHGFFNYGKSREMFEKTTRAADDFLVAQGILPPAEKTTAPAGAKE